MSDDNVTPIRPRRTIVPIVDEHLPMTEFASPAHGIAGQPELHVFQEHAGSDIEVWLNTGVADFDGLCIGAGPTRDIAIGDAIKTLEWAADTLQGPPPGTIVG